MPGFTRPGRVARSMYSRVGAPDHGNDSDPENALGPSAPAANRPANKRPVQRAHGAVKLRQQVPERKRRDRRGLFRRPTQAEPLPKRGEAAGLALLACSLAKRTE